MSDRFQNIATELADAGRAFHGRSWMLGTSGNLSAVVDHDPFRLAITRSGVDKGSLTPEQILELDGDGNKVAEYPGHPSTETRLHLGIVGSRDAGAVFHTHSMWATIVSEAFGDQRGLWIEGYEMLKGLEGVATHEHSEWIPILENSQDMAELADRIDQVLGQQPSVHGILIRRHGLYTWGENITQARRHVEILGFLLEVTGRVWLPKENG